jgi:orotate phosphoribosyltransferase-like protein
MYGNASGDAARQAREIANAGLKATEDSVRVRMDELQISRELAQYLLSLEARITQLEQLEHCSR